MTTGNQFQKAQTVLKSLIEGLDPETGDELPKSTIVNRIEINRALHVAVTALEQMQLRLQRRAQLPPGVGKSWTAEEENQLLQEVADNTPLEDIAKAHGRTLRAIEARAMRMGLLDF